MNVSLIVKKVARIKNGITISVRVGVKNTKEHRVSKSIWNPTTRSSENGEFVGSIIDDSKTIPTRSASTNVVLTKCNSTNFYVLLAFLLISIALVAVGIYCFFIKCQEKQKLFTILLLHH